MTVLTIEELAAVLQPNQAVAGLDLGTKTIGLSMSDIGRRFATPRPVLTDRQRDCVLWVARGKSDWEISLILGIREETVARHIKQACERYGVNKRTYLVILALFDGTLTFSDIFRRRYYPFPG